MPDEVQQPIGALRPTNVGRGPAQSKRRPRQGIALCLSGGGYRAAIFHAGVLRRLNELGILGKVDAFSCVSGGSIIGGYLASAIHRGLQLVDGKYPCLDKSLDEFQAFMRKDIRTLSALARLKFWESPGKAPRRLERYYEQMVGRIPLTALPRSPRFIFCATNLFFANSWVCERRRVGDYLSGYVEPPPEDWTLARAIALSSCFPPVFDPAVAGIETNQFQPPLLSPDDDDDSAHISPTEQAKLDDARKHITLTDGGVYDNLGLEPIWKSYKTVLVSDGGKPMQHRYVVPGLRLMRYQQVITNQVLSLRKRWLIDVFLRATRGTDDDSFDGAYWGIMSSPKRYVPDAKGYSKGLAAIISNIRTDLNPFSPNEIAVLEKHGYELVDAAIATHMPRLLPSAGPNGQLLIPPGRRWPPSLEVESRVASSLSWSGSRLLSLFTSRQSNLVEH